MSVCCECCVLLRRRLCVGLYTRAEDPTECGVSEYDREAWITLATLRAVEPLELGGVLLNFTFCGVRL